ncbi:DNA phosphorothioation-associated putative methyltransferase [Microcoleus sp. FACHB-68]|uniref:DNA phosphorothioation-associated putative methyltransferase n=1 Tax=Microcoleus sp. FACHB-68 TaxID=2692826 RepID=UPI0016834AD5|nr:DNA phosphorothioation-associated putative methyltransferase [Microcoleus sp. FACHB-68]MBD1936324.1 DNA phosphorothioation-associated putative methyltransferase [Microcoleus sp. FACHB-68]
MVALVPEALEIERHRAAMVRTDLSKPVRLAIESAIFTEHTSFFDYGCGHGGDVTRLANLGCASTGWDPYYCPDAPITPADIVNIGYVINVIEDPEERRHALQQAWDLTGQVLIVAAQVLISNRSSDQIAYGDGIVTRRNTFQKYYEQAELKTYIDTVLNVDAVPVDLGIYFVFRDAAQAQSFRVSCFRSFASTPRIRIPSKRFEDYQEQLAPLMAFVTHRGRLPVKGELPEEIELNKEFGSIRRAFQVILLATDEEDWDAIAYRRSLDLLVYLALTHFGHRPSARKLAPEIKHDIKAFFGTYDEACETADRMLFSLGNPGVVAGCCQRSQIGKKLRNALYVHVSALEQLDPLLRIYEGCASRTIGCLEGATLIKFHTDKPKISYLFYPDFDTEPHPALHTSMQIDLRDLDVKYSDYDTSDNPPILHRKETFVTPDYPRYEEFAQLTQQEENWGLLENTSTIGRHKGWQECLAENYADIRGHCVYWREDAEPSKVAALRSARPTLEAGNCLLFMKETDEVGACGKAISESTLNLP